MYNDKVSWKISYLEDFLVDSVYCYYASRQSWECATPLCFTIMSEHWYPLLAHSNSHNNIYICGNNDHFTSSMLLSILSLRTMVLKSVYIGHIIITWDEVTSSQVAHFLLWTVQTFHSEIKYRYYCGLMWVGILVMFIKCPCLSLLTWREAFVVFYMQHC